MFTFVGEVDQSAGCTLRLLPTQRIGDVQLPYDFTDIFC